jgi:hypothetical protein
MNGGRRFAMKRIGYFLFAIVILLASWLTLYPAAAAGTTDKLLDFLGGPGFILMVAVAVASGITLLLRRPLARG